MGLLVGLAGTALTRGALAGCEATTGTGSCGQVPGFLVLLVIVALMVLLGVALLRVAGIAEPVGTSLLGVGVICVVVLVALLGVVLSAWMFVAVPLTGAVAFVLARWVTTRALETTDTDEGPGHDVR